MGFFIRFAEVLVRCLCFHFSTYVVHAMSENHCKLEIWAVTNMVTAQVVSCLVCDVPTDGVWGQEQWVRRGFAYAVVPIATK